MSPTTNTSGWPGRRAVGVDPDPAGAVGLGAAGAASEPAERRGGHAGRPDLRAGIDRRRRAVAGLDVDAFPVHADDHRAGVDLDAEAAEVPGGLAGRAARRTSGGRRRHPRAGARGPAAGSIRRKLSLQSAVGQLGDLPGHLHPGRAAADDDEREPRSPGRSVRLGLGHLERPEDPRPQLAARRRSSSSPVPTARTRGGRSRTSRNRWRRSGCRTGSRSSRRAARP